MKITWKNFAQRRKLNLEMFSTMTYENYAEWCDIRSVEPVSKESFEGVKSMVTTPVPQKIEKSKVAVPSFDSKQLKKLRKNALVELCENNKIFLDGEETKGALIELLLSLNNND